MEEQHIVPTVDFEWDSTFFGGDYSDSGETSQVPTALIDTVGYEVAFEQFSRISSRHIVAWSPEESEAYGNGVIAEQLQRAQRNLWSFADRHMRKCAYCFGIHLQRLAESMQEIRTASSGKYRLLMIDKFDNSCYVDCERDDLEEALAFARYKTEEARGGAQPESIDTVWYVYDDRGTFVGPH